MAASSITADFRCNEPKAANAFVRMMFSPKALSSRDVPDTSSVRIRDDMRRSEKRDIYYQRYWNSIGCIQIPHHGSRNSFNDEFGNLNAFFVISAGLGNHYHHPHAEVIAALREKGHLPAVVTQDPFSMFATLVR